MQVAISADHAGFETKQQLVTALTERGYTITDLGAHSTEPVDYPDFAEAVAQAIRSSQVERGIIVCGSGAGVSIVANKFPGVRAAVCHDLYTAHQAVEHDDLNVLCLGARVINPKLALEITENFLKARFTGEDRHRRRLDKLLAVETKFLRS